MKAVILASLLTALSFATFASAQEVVDISGIRYRVSAVNSSLILVPDVSFATQKPDRVLAHDEKLSRSDEFAALALEAQGPAAGGIRLVRERVEPRPEERTWVLYAQRHQGYRILGAGGRLELDSYGRVIFAGLTYETEDLRTFRPMAPAALEKIAALAVPHPREGPPVSQELMVDPLGDAPGELRAFVVYQVKNNDLVEGWQVILDAETGKVVDSFSLFVHAESPAEVSPRLEPLDQPRHEAPQNRPRPEALDKPRPPAGEVTPVVGPHDPIAYDDYLVVYVDIFGECVALQIRYINEYNEIETRIATYSQTLYVYPGTSMTVDDATLASRTCSREFALNGAVVGLSYTFAVLNYDAISLTEDCRPAVRSPESTSSTCFNRILSVDRIQPWQLTYNTTLSEGPITSVARWSNQSDFLSVPCQTLQIPPSTVTVVDNTRFDEVNAFYQAREFIDDYLWPRLGVPLTSGFRILTKRPESSFGITGFDMITRVAYFGEGDAYNNPGGGLHGYDASKFATVIQHEVTHALTSQLYGWTFPSAEARAVNEGVADYMASSFSNNSVVGLCYLSNFDHVRNSDNLATDFRYSRLAICQYPVSTGATAAPGSPHAQGMIASGLLWDMRRTIGASATDRILGDALRALWQFPNFNLFGTFVLNAAIASGYECQVRPLLVAREFPGISPGGAVTPTGLVVTTSMPDRCKIYATWSGTATSYKVTWTPDGGSEAILSASQTAKFWGGSIGTKNGGTVKVYSIYCGVTNNTPAIARRDEVTATFQSPAIRLTNRVVAGGTETLVEWDDYPGTPNWRLLRNGVAWGPDLPASTRSKIDPPGCGGTVTYCVQIVDCAGTHGTIGTCGTITRPGTPLSVTMSGPTALPYNTPGTFTANITGGCGLARIDWYWMIESSSGCGGGGGGGGPIETPIVYDPATTGATSERGTRGVGEPSSQSPSDEVLIPPCGTWYRYSLPATANPIVKSFGYGTYWQLKVIVTDLVGATATAIKRIHTGSSMTYDPGELMGQVEADRKLPMKLEWNGTSIALVNVKSSSAGDARLQLFDVAGRRRAEVVAPLAGSSRIEFSVAKDLARGVYFAKCDVPGHQALRRTIVVK